MVPEKDSEPLLEWCWTKANYYIPNWEIIKGTIEERGENWPSNGLTPAVAECQVWRCFRPRRHRDE